MKVESPKVRGVSWVTDGEVPNMSYKSVSVGKACLNHLYRFTIQPLFTFHWLRQSKVIMGKFHDGKSALNGMHRAILSRK